MNVKELIEKLQTFPLDLPVCYRKYSEFCLLTAEDISIEEAGLPRDDGWVPDKRPDKPTQTYLICPGN